MKNLEWEEKFTNLFEDDKYGMKRLICIYPESLLHNKTLLKSLGEDTRVAQLFNADLSHIQQYLFTKLKIEPASKVEVQYDEKESRLIKITKMDEDSVAAPLPFSIMYFEIHTTSSTSYFDHDVNDPITEIRARYQEEREICFEGNEDSIFHSFCEYVLAKDPDILFSSTPYSRRTITLDYLFMRMKKLGLDLQLGREKKANKVEGRILLSNQSAHTELDLSRLVERARFGFLPLGMAAYYGMNRLVDSRHSFDNHERIRTLDEIIAKDKGGMIFSPQVGLHENVMVLDYENEYANLILKHNLSYETVTSTKDGRIIREREEEIGLLPTVLERVLK